jgi:hypothetical protein
VFEVVRAAGVACGLIVEKVSLFSFGMGNHYMEGVIVSAGSALALIGYVFAVVWQFVRRSIGRHNPWSPSGSRGEHGTPTSAEFVQKLARLSNLPACGPVAPQSRLVENEAEMQRANSGTPGIAVGCDSQ